MRITPHATRSATREFMEQKGRRCQARERGCASTRVHLGVVATKHSTAPRCLPSPQSCHLRALFVGFDAHRTRNEGGRRRLRILAPLVSQTGQVFHGDASERRRLRVLVLYHAWTHPHTVTHIRRYVGVGKQRQDSQTSSRR